MELVTGTLIGLGCNSKLETIVQRDRCATSKWEHRCWHEVRSFAMEDMPLDTARATFTSPGMSGVLRGNEFKIDYNFSGEDTHPLDRLQNLAHFMVISGQRCSVALTLDMICRGR